MTMLVHFSQGPGHDNREKTVAVNPAEVASVDKLPRSNDWALITMRDKREYAVIGTVESVMEKLNKVEYLQLLNQPVGEDK
jgi:hypothetical protein